MPSWSGPDNKVELRTIETDRAVGDQWLVTSGLKAGDRVIVEGMQFAKPGSKVVPEEYRPPRTSQTAPRPASDRSRLQQNRSRPWSISSSTGRSSPG